MGYVELRCKSNFSFLTGASHPEELLETAVASGLTGLALTDLDGVYGMPRGYKVARQHPNFKYIVGAELTLTDYENLTVLTRTRAAYARLCQLLTAAKKNFAKGEGRLTLEGTLAHLQSVADEVLVLPRFGEKINSAKSELGALKDTFKENLYLPMTVYLDGNDKRRVKALVELSRRYAINLVASNDVEYHVKPRKILQDVLIAIREGRTLEEVGFKIRSNGERYIKSEEAIRRLYKDFLPEVDRTVELASGCTFSPSELKYRYPSEWIPSGFSSQSYLEYLVYKEAPTRYKNGLSDRVQAQLKHELQLIEQLSYADYFLTIYDIVEFAKKRDILCQGRGSAANSVVCYVLGITAIDPIQMDLLFERFISAERGEPPDIDIDFEHERREEVIQYIYEKYGRHRAAMVSAVVTYQYRSAFREVCKAFGLPVGTLSAKKVERGFSELTAGRGDVVRLREQIDSIANELHGFPRHLSIHSGGFTLSADPIVDIVPVEPARMDGRTIIQWDKYDLDTLGLIKVDVLSLGMLSCLRKTLNRVGLKLYEIPHDDRPTYEMIHRTETVGVFQIESRAQMSMLGRLLPKNFYDLVIEVAIVRPGPIVGKMVHPYLKRRRGLEKIVYPNATVERILGKTLGVPLFQEQIMKLAIELAKFTAGEADQLRKCINAWRTSAPIGAMADRLKRGLMAAGMTEQFADQIFEQIQGFSHYGFPESHAASFALLAYASCYLKCHYPAEFACSLINSQPMGFYRPDTILYEAIRNGVQVLPVSILKSQWDCEIESPNAIRLGFRLVKGVARRDVDALIAERDQLAFNGLADFVNRSQIRKDVLHRLSVAGRFADFKMNSREALWAILEYQNLFRNNESDQLSLFSDTAFITEVQPVATTTFSEPGEFEKIQSDYAAFSLSTHGHPMTALRRQIRRLPKMTSSALRTMSTNSRVSVAGLILVRQRPPTANGVCFATLEDEFGFVDMVLWRDVFERHREIFLNHCFVIASGRMQRDVNTISLIVDKVEPVWAAGAADQTPLNVEPSQYFYG